MARERRKIGADGVLFRKISRDGVQSAEWRATSDATVLPMQSEAVRVGLLLSETYSPWMLIGVASMGNVLGFTVGDRRMELGD